MRTLFCIVLFLLASSISGLGQHDEVIRVLRKKGSGGSPSGTSSAILILNPGQPLILNVGQPLILQ